MKDNKEINNELNYQDTEQVAGGNDNGVIIITTGEKREALKETMKQGLKPYRCEKCGQWIEATQFWHICVD